MVDLRSSSPTFIIERLAKEDEGTYSCLASNVAGQTEERLQVMVTDQQEHVTQHYNPPPPQPQQNDLFPSRPYHNQEYPSQPQYEPSQPYPPRDRETPEEPDRSQPQSRYPPPVGYQFQFEEDYDDQGYERPNSIGLVEHEVNTREGMNVDLTCMNIGTMPGNTVAVWSRVDGASIDTRHKKSDGVLHIRGAKKSDQGKYVCQLITTNGDVIFQLQANLVVQGSNI